jgi:hypothetical protein
MDLESDKNEEKPFKETIYLQMRLEDGSASFILCASKQESNVVSVVCYNGPPTRNRTRTILSYRNQEKL